MTPKLPRPPHKGDAPTKDAKMKADAPAPAIPAPTAVHPGLEAMTKNDAKLVNLDTGTHVDSKGVEHTTHPGNKPQVGPLTIVFASKMGHPPTRFGDHAKQKTSVHKHMMGKAKPHPNALALAITKKMNLPRAPQPVAAMPTGAMPPNAPQGA